MEGFEEMVCKKWSEKEVELLKSVFADSSKEELEDIFKREYNSIRVKASKLKLKRNIKSYVKEGRCTCKKCGETLPWNGDYFPILRKEINPRQVCRKCNPKYGRYIEEHSQRNYWTVDMEKELREKYPYYTNRELIEMETFKCFNVKNLSDKASNLNISKSQELIERRNLIVAEKIRVLKTGVIMSVETKRKISDLAKLRYENGFINPRKGTTNSEKSKKLMSLLMREKGQWKGKNNPRHSNPLTGKDNGRWKGGITDMYSMLRSNITEWRQESMSNCDYKCVITGLSFDEIHHLTPFNKIVESALCSLNMNIRQVKDYTETEIENLIELVKQIHSKELGVCLTKKVHKEFHDKYGYINVSKEDFIEFKNNYK